MKAELMKYVSGRGYDIVDLGTKATSDDGKPKRVSRNTCEKIVCRSPPSSSRPYERWI